MTKADRFYNFFNRYWLYIGLGLKFILLFAIVYADHLSKANFFSGIAGIGGDYSEQLGTIDNLVDFGTISQEAHINGKPYADRTPGFIFPYIFYRFFLSTYWALQIQVVLQIVLTVIAAKCFYELILEYTQKKSLAILSFFVIAICNYVTWLDFEVSPESFSNSAYIISIYFFNRYIKGMQMKHLLFSGMFAAWCFFLRGYTIAYASAFLLAISYITWVKKKDILLFVKASFVFFIPFILCVSIWATRNYIQFHKFIPLQNVFVPGIKSEVEEDYNSVIKQSVLRVRKLISIWGGDCLWTYPNTEMNWIIRMTDEEAKNYKFSEKIFCEGFNRDSLDKLRFLIRESMSKNYTNEQHKEMELNIISKCDEYTAALRENNSLLYFMSPFLRITNFFNKNVVPDWPIRKGSLVYFYKFIPLVLYFLFGLGAFIGMIWLVFKREMKLLTVLLVGHIFILLLEFGYLIELIQYRYYATAYLASVFVFFVFASSVMNKIKRLNA